MVNLVASCLSIVGGLSACAAETSIEHPSCWIGAPQTSETGVAEIGHGSESFEPLDERLPVYRGIQGGYHTFLNARVEGLFPGRFNEKADDPTGTLPQTLFTVYAEDGTQVSADTCAQRKSYVENDDQTLTLQAARRVVLDREFIADAVERTTDTKVRVVMNVLDCEGVYAHDERRLLLALP